MGEANSQLMQFFDWLLWVSLQGSVMIILIVLIQLILRHRLPTRLNYFIWVLLLIRLAVPWLPESKISIFNLVPRSIQQGRIIESFSESQRMRELRFSLISEYADTQESKPESGYKIFFAEFVRILPLIWLVGSLLMSFYICIRNISLWLTVKRERPITDEEILELLEDCKMQMGIQTILGVVVSDRVKSPALFGFVRPRLLLPQGMLETYDLEELRYVFIHELAHLKQRDIYFGWLMALLHTLHWFNPLMWFAFRRMRADREIACDTLAISRMNADEPHKYGKTIVTLLESFSQVRYTPSVAGILEDTCQIERRIKMIAKTDKKISRPQWAGATLLLAVFACMVLTNAYVAKADFTFGTPINLGPTINGPDDMLGVCISHDSLELYFCSNRPGGYGGYDIWVSTRPTIDDEWGEPVNLGPNINSQYDCMGPSISADGLTLYFSDFDYGAHIPGGSGSTDIWMVTRETKDAEWSTPVNLGQLINWWGGDNCPNISTDGLSLYFGSSGSRFDPDAPGWYDLWVATRATTEENWDSPEYLGSTVNSSLIDLAPCLSNNGLVLFFCSNRIGGYGDFDIWMTSRATKEHNWHEPVNLGPVVNTWASEGFPSISADGSTLYFCSSRPGGYGGTYGDIWQVSIEPIVDFNSGGNIDTDDLLMLIGSWGQNEPLCDIGPTPLGDGIVDMKDLEVFMSYWEKENMAEGQEDSSEIPEENE
jgi:bla regulator protein BlaR1